jgi:8-oxo-dGTP pyrophosphatase MutT (NUDIX family)
MTAMLRALLGGVGRRKGLRGPDAAEFSAWLTGDYTHSSEHADADGVNYADDSSSTTAGASSTAAPTARAASVAAVLRLVPQDGSAGTSYEDVLHLLQVCTAGDDLLAAELLLIKRADNVLDHWSGHVALPGGRRNRGEGGLAAAVREVQEETGVHLQSSTHALLGLLKERTARGSDLSCYVFVALDAAAAAAPLVPQASEIAHAWWVDASQFWPEPIVEQVGYPINSFPQATASWHVRAFVKWLRLHTVYFPCFYLTPPSITDSTGSSTTGSSDTSSSSAAESWVIWGLTFGMLSDLVECAGGEPCSSADYSYSFNSAPADALMAFSVAAAKLARRVGTALGLYKPAVKQITSSGGHKLKSS